MQEFFNDYVQSLETYIMFRIKETVARITPELIAKDRAPILYSLDRNKNIRFSHENPDVLKMYEEFFEKPNSPVAHKLLHTDHHAWDM